MREALKRRSLTGFGIVINGYCEERETGFLVRDDVSLSRKTGRMRHNEKGAARC
jgi:hypothetical protein